MSDNESDKNVMVDPQPVICRVCGLLVGWSATELTDFVCIPDFDMVKIIRKPKESKEP